MTKKDHYCYYIDVQRYFPNPDVINTILDQYCVKKTPLPSVTWYPLHPWYPYAVEDIQLYIFFYLDVFSTPVLCFSYIVYYNKPFIMRNYETYLNKHDLFGKISEKLKSKYFFDI